MTDAERIQQLKNDYVFFKELLKDTELAKFFKDEHPYASIQQRRDFPDGAYFISLRTGVNSDQYVSFVIKDEQLLGHWDHFLTNYSGYRCYCTPNFVIHEDIGYGFGSWRYITYDRDGNQLSDRSKQDYGCCCG